MQGLPRVGGRFSRGPYLKHPQDRFLPVINADWIITHSFPHTHLHLHHPRFASSLTQTAVSRPNTFPASFLYLAILHLFAPLFIYKNGPTGAGALPLKALSLVINIGNDKQ